MRHFMAFVHGGAARGPARFGARFVEATVMGGAAATRPGFAGAAEGALGARE